jgi:hypothetical protein
MSNITKLGLGIVAFEGTELIKSITAEIRNEVDYIVVCLQRKSYHGQPIDQFDIDETEMCKRAGLVDEIIWYDPDLSYLNTENFDPKIPRLLETDKRNMMIQHLEDNGCSHDIIIDSDEFYKYENFKRAKEIFNNDNSMHVSYCQYINFYRDTQHYMLWPWDSYVPFIADIKYRFVYEKGTFNKPSDPTRRYYIPENDECKHFHIFNWNVINMNHLSWIRLDITKKLDAWSSKKYFDNVPNLKEKILDRYFNYRDGQNAIIMFNVPFYQAVVNKLDKQYFKLKYRLNERIA